MSTLADERAKLEQAIVALEAQRDVLGDVAVDVALAALRQKLAAMQTPDQPAEQRKQVTVLFADIVGFTAMSNSLDAEDVTALMNVVWQRLDAVIVSHRGAIDKHIGDAVMAVWGTQAAREDDPEQAIRAALAMQAELRAFASTQHRPLQMRIGINTGPVLLGAVGTRSEYTAMGDTVNLASRLQHNAPIGGVLISHDTFRQVRGVFDLSAQEPLLVKGKTEPLQTYIVMQAKPRAFRLRTRGVEGVETRMIGRVSELNQLHDILRAVIERRELRAVTIIGEAGVGKSRLLYEFGNRVDLMTEKLCLFRGRASEETSRLPYALLRDLFAFRFEIADSDPLSLAHEKLEQGIVGWMRNDADAMMKAHFIGHLIGLDYSASPHLRGILNDAKQIRDRAIYYLSQFMTAATLRPQNAATVILLEDLQWADDGSLDALTAMMSACRILPMMILGLARPTLLERRPRWCDSGTRIDVQLLSPDESRQLVDEILKKVPAVPQALRELIVSGAEGNPFYLEELVKMLIDEKVIIPGDDEWRVEPVRLATVRVPSTLTGVLQARLDSLPSDERETLQRASVAGRVFWDSAVAALSDTPAADLSGLRNVLSALCRRELIFHRKVSTFAGAEEYVFQHTLLRDVTYETVLKRLRRGYHARAANWLIEQSGERVDEYAGLIAEHYERASDSAHAVDWYARAGAVARSRSAFTVAVSYLTHAVALTPRDAPSFSSLARQLGAAHLRLGDLPSARQALQDAQATALTDLDRSAALTALAEMMNMTGDYAGASALLAQALPLARAVNGRATVARALEILGGINWQRGKLDEARVAFDESLVLAVELGDVMSELSTLNGLGAVALAAHEFAQAEQIWHQVYERAVAVGNRERAMVTLNNLASVANERKDYAIAREHFQQAQTIAREIGSQRSLALYLINQARTNIDLGNLDQARTGLREGLALALRLGALPWAVGAVMYFASLAFVQGQADRALELYGMVSHHPAWSNDHQRGMNEDLAAWKLDDAQVQAGLARGKQLNWEATVQELLAEK
ncbi:MAG: tetratricopeptide repeat protein [Chloroflexi bacterium]|nr:tetratricopeptide repeat protein [Chloroflexota bacterium]